MTASTHAYSDLPDCDTNNATRIGWQDWVSQDYWPADYLPESKKKYFEYLDRLNSGRQNGHKWQNKSYNTYEINRHLVQCLGGRLKMTDWEKKRATTLVDALQRDNTGHSSEQIGLCVCAYVLHQYNDHRECHPQTSPENLDPFVEEERQNLNITSDQFESVYGKVAHKIRSGNLQQNRHDKYEVDQDAPQTWRWTNESDQGWL